MNEELKNKINETGSKIDDKVEETSEKYGIPKWIVWVGAAIAVSAIVKIIF